MKTTQLLGEMAEIARRAGYDEAARVIAAYLLDRADQYDTESPCWIALAHAAKGVMKGEPLEAERHGEYDADLYRRVDGMRGKAPPVNSRAGVDE